MSMTKTFIGGGIVCIRICIGFYLKVNLHRIQRLHAATITIFDITTMTTVFVIFD